MQLDRRHAEQIGRAVTPMLRYLGRLRDRMNEVGFVPSDPLYRQVCETYNAVHRLSVHLH